MNTEKIVALTCLLSLSGLNARAQQINWNNNPLKDLQVALAGQKTVVPVPQTRLVKDAPAAMSAVNLEGKALGSTVIGNDDRAYNDKVTLMLNNDKTRAGATFSNCPAPSSDYPGDCETPEVNFVFPQLTVDAKARVIKFGEQIVARNRAIFGLGDYSLTNGWSFVVTKKRQTIDDGFNRRTITRVAVSLVK